MIGLHNNNSEMLIDFNKLTIWGFVTQQKNILLFHKLYNVKTLFTFSLLGLPQIADISKQASYTYIISKFKRTNLHFD